MQPTTKPFFDSLDYSAPFAASEIAAGKSAKPTTAALRLNPLNFVNRGYDVAGRIDPRAAIQLGRTMNPSAPIVIDDEDRLLRMFTMHPSPAPTHHEERQRAAAELIELARCIAATPEGAAAAANGLGFYQGIIGAGHPENGARWWDDYKATNRIVFGSQTKPGAPMPAETLASVTTRPIVSLYVTYNADRLERQRLKIAFETAHELYGAAPLAFVGLRYPSGYEEPARRFDYVRAEHMDRALEIGYAHAAGIVLWTWNGYGPAGYRGARDRNGYPTEIGGNCGAAWEPSLPAWQAVETFRAKLSATTPTTATMHHSDTAALFPRDNRGRIR